MVSPRLVMLCDRSTGWRPKFVDAALDNAIPHLSIPRDEHIFMVEADFGKWRVLCDAWWFKGKCYGVPREGAAWPEVEGAS